MCLSNATLEYCDAPIRCYKLLIDTGWSIISPYQKEYMWDLGKEMHYALGNVGVDCEDEEFIGRDDFLLNDTADCSYVKPRYCVSSGFIHSCSRPSFAAEHAIPFLATQSWAFLLRWSRSLKSPKGTLSSSEETGMRWHQVGLSSSGS